jgi:hypothetical protein
MHVKANRDCGFDFYRLAIQKKWLVVPLLDRLAAAAGCCLPPPKSVGAATFNDFGAEFSQPYFPAVYASHPSSHAVNGTLAAGLSARL